MSDSNPKELASRDWRELTTEDVVDVLGDERTTVDVRNGGVSFVHPEADSTIVSRPRCRLVHPDRQSTAVKLSFKVSMVVSPDSFGTTTDDEPDNEPTEGDKRPTKATSPDWGLSAVVDGDDSPE